MSRGVLSGLAAVLTLASGAMLVSCSAPPTTPGGATPAAGTLEAIQPPSGGEMLLIPAGEFTMGQEGGRADEAPHAVSVNSLYMDRYLVTQELYEKVMGVNPSKQKGKRNPAERLQWTDAVRFCNKCSELDGFSPCYDPQTWECRFEANGYRLPTEAEWEYACRAGSRGRYCFGDDAAKAPQYAWFKPHSGGVTRPVGQKLPNAWGLSDMHGNVWEWCNDWYGESYYPESPRENPRGPASGKQRVLRGGAWDCTADKCTAAYRSKEFPTFADACFGSDTYGFRRVRSVADAPKVPSAKVETKTGFGQVETAPKVPSAKVETKAGAVTDETAPKKVTPGCQADWSPDGRQIVFIRENQAWVRDLASGQERRVTPEAWERCGVPAVAPDGKKLAVASRHTGTIGIYLLSLDGKENAPLKTEEAACTPRWSKDGQRLLCQTVKGHIHQVGADGKNWEQVTFGADLQHDGRYSPDGSMVIFSRAPSTDGPWQICVSRLGGDEMDFAQLTTEGSNLQPDWYLKGAALPAAAPPGGKMDPAQLKGTILFVSDRGGTLSIWSMRANGKDPKPLTRGTEPEADPRFSPDGKRILYTALRGGFPEVWVMDLDVSALQDEDPPAAPPRAEPKAEKAEPAGKAQAPLPTGFLYDPLFLEHQVSAGHPERPQRLEAIVKRLKEKGLSDKLLALKAAPAAVEWLTTVHTPEYVERAKKACAECGDGIRILDTADVPISAKSYDAAVLAAGGVLAAVDAVVDGKARNAFCAVRPPGHHALKDKAMGFCIFGNVAIAARYIQQKHKLAKVLIVDWDVHHGNGTQYASYDDPSILHFDVHRSPFYPGSGNADEKGAGKGLGFKINVPLPGGSTDKDYREAFETKLKPAALEFQPDFVLISAGFDAYKDDPLGGMKLTAEGYAELTRIVIGIAERCCQGRIVSVLEGGYDLEGLADSVEAHIRVLMK